MGFVIYKLVVVPEPPREYRQKQNAMTIVSYPAEEGQLVSAGTAIAILENRWARFELTCLPPCRVAKNLFSSALGSVVAIGAPIGLLFLDPDDFPEDEPVFELWHLSDLRPRPSAKRRRASR